MRQTEKEKVKAKMLLGVTIANKLKQYSKIKIRIERPILEYIELLEPKAGLYHESHANATFPSFFVLRPFPGQDSSVQVLGSPRILLKPVAGRRKS